MAYRDEDDRGLVDGIEERTVDDWLDDLYEAATVERETDRWLQKSKAMPNIYPTHPEVEDARMQSLKEAQEKLHEGRHVFAIMGGTCGDLCRNVMLEHYIGAESWKQVGIRNTLSRTSVWRLQRRAKDWLAENLEDAIADGGSDAGIRG